LYQREKRLSSIGDSQQTQGIPGIEVTSLLEFKVQVIQNLEDREESKI
jgi:hypothetical protein